ncbi:MAG: hypothetical protein Q8Q06_03945 [bacterium]|nr:hypothetical protein [bacterium]
MRRKDFLVFIFLTILIVISLAYWLSYIEIPKYSKRFIRLENVDKEKYDYVKRITNNPIFKNNKVEFYVDFINWQSTVDIRGNIFINYGTLNSPCLDFTIYHELGHLQDGVRDDQIKADYFSVAVLGPDKTFDCVMWLFNRSKGRLGWYTRLDVYARLFAIKNGLKSKEDFERYMTNDMLKE